MRRSVDPRARAAALVAAVRAGEARQVRFHLAAGADPNDNKTVNLVELAILSRNPEVLHWLLAYGADPDKPGTDGEALLTQCILAGNYEAFRELLKAGADPSNNQKGWSVLAHAVSIGGARYAQALIRFGADAAARLEDRRTMLHLVAVAPEEKRDAMWHLLVKAGADPYAVDAAGRPAISASLSPAGGAAFEAEEFREEVTDRGEEISPAPGL